jgi:hypothetical protein
MTITFELDDALVPSIEAYISTQIRVENDPVTKAQRMIRLYPDPESFLEDALHQVVHQVVKQYPTQAIRDQMAAAQQIEEQIKESVRPRQLKQVQ